MVFVNTSITGKETPKRCVILTFRNVTQRTNKDEIERHVEINSRVHQSYTYPDGCTPLPITRIPSSV
jgi:hypothetical protein